MIFVVVFYRTCERFTRNGVVGYTHATLIFTQSNSIEPYIAH